ncbi:MAG: class II aldolase/adducin family protein [Bacteroidota bacterium]
MKFAVIRNGSNSKLNDLADGIVRACLAHGHEISSETNGVRFVLNLTNVEAPRAFRRRSQSIFVVSLVAMDELREDAQSVCYRTLVRSLSNLVLCVVPSTTLRPTGTNGRSEIYFTTPEAGFYLLPFDLEAIYQRILPIVSSHFATDNRFTVDLPAQYCGTSPIVEKIKRYGRELDALGVLPAPFPLRQILSEEDLQHIYRIYGITGASYGNLSARERIPELGKTTFWMTGRGVNKANIAKVGRDVLLVKGFDDEHGAALLSVPAYYDPKARVSVDAVEHSLIYRTFSDVGAIVHVHAWMDGVLSTRQNYPCGTRELAEEVVGLLHQTDDPSQAAVGLKNHGLTITGHSLGQIFERIRGKLLTEVPMFA